MEDCGQQGMVCVPELNSNSFYHIVMAQNVVSARNYLVCDGSWSATEVNVVTSTSV
jgi:hypothetical protein